MSCARRLLVLVVFFASLLQCTLAKIILNLVCESPVRFCEVDIRSDDLNFNDTVGDQTWDNTNPPFNSDPTFYFVRLCAEDQNVARCEIGRYSPGETLRIHKGENSSHLGFKPVPFEQVKYLGGLRIPMRFPGNDTGFITVIVQLFAKNDTDRHARGSYFVAESDPIPYRGSLDDEPPAGPSFSIPSSSAPAPTATPSTTSEAHSSKTPIIIGSVLGSLAALALLLLALLLLLRHRHRKPQPLFAKVGSRMSLESRPRPSSDYLDEETFYAGHVPVFRAQPQRQHSDSMPIPVYETPLPPLPALELPSIKIDAASLVSDDTLPSYQPGQQQRGSRHGEGGGDSKNAAGYGYEVEDEKGRWIERDTNTVVGAGEGV